MVLAVVLLAGFAGVTHQWLRAEAEATRANREALRANRTARAEAEARAAESTLRIRAQAEIAARDFDRGLELAGKGDVDHGLVWMAESLGQAPAERPEFARIVRANLAGWEGQVLRRRAILEHSRHAANSPGSRPDGRMILTGSYDHTARFWETATGRPLGPPLEHNDRVTCHAFSPDGRRVATGSRTAMCGSGTSTPAGPSDRPWSTARRT